MKLYRESILNPYYINGKQVTVIHFYDQNGNITTHKRGWFGSNNRGNEYLESLEFRNARKVNLKRGDAFVVPNKERASFGAACCSIYIPLDPAHVTLLGERVALKTDTETCYGDYIRIDGDEYMLAYYTRTELTEQGEFEVALGNRLKELGIESYHARKLLQEFPCIKEAL